MLFVRLLLFDDTIWIWRGPIVWSA